MVKVCLNLSVCLSLGLTELTWSRGVVLVQILQMHSGMHMPPIYVLFVAFLFLQIVRANGNAHEWNARGMDSFAARNVAAAAYAFGKAAQLSPDNPVHWWNLGHAEFIQKRYDKAEMAFLQAHQLNASGDPAVLLRLGLCHVRASRSSSLL